MVADAPGDGNQTGFPGPDRLLPGGIFVQLKDRFWAVNCPIRFPRPAVRPAPPRMGNIDPVKLPPTSGRFGQPQSVHPRSAPCLWASELTFGRSVSAAQHGARAVIILNACSRLRIIGKPAARLDSAVCAGAGAGVSGSDPAGALAAPYQFCDAQDAQVVRAGGDEPETFGFGCDSHIRRFES
jgi:hypothetical protein